MTEPKRIAVLGAGYVGSALAREACRQGHAVWAVRRTLPADGDDGVHWVRGDVASGQVDGLSPALDAVVLTVAPSRTDHGYAGTYPPAAAGAVALATATGARSLLYTSSTGVYGGRGGLVVTESSPRAGTGEGNVALGQAEDIVLASEAARPTVLRVAGIYGPGRDPRGRMRDASALPQRGGYWVNLAHRDDIVGALLHLIGTVAAPAVLNCSDGSPTLAADVARWLAKQDGRDPASLRFDNDAEPSRNDQCVSNAALRAVGWAPRFPSFREGFTRGLS
ncbi:MAG: NAD-dependent epimerase/dehydratase family protein [Gemmatimonadota bacterium]